MKFTYPKIHSSENLQNYLDNFLLKEIRAIGCVITVLDMKESGILLYTITYNGYELGNIQFKYTRENECWIECSLIQKLNLHSISHYIGDKCIGTNSFISSSRERNEYNDNKCNNTIINHIRKLILSYKTINIQMKKQNIAEMFK